MSIIKAPFPWFGGKSRVAPIVWKAFGDVPNYVEPFFGSGAVLLNRPHEPRIETVNDKDGFVSNFFRAVKHAPDEVAEWASNPVNENDLHARHIWLVERRDTLVSYLEGDPDYYDAKIAGWWVWGICCWIGAGWCSGKGPWRSVPTANGMRKLLRVKGIEQGINRTRVHLGNAGLGVNRLNIDVKEWFEVLSTRLQDVRVCCGDWSRVTGPTPTFKRCLTGVFLDPPYSAAANRAECYVQEDFTVAHDVRKWCIENAYNERLRIALCGYDVEHKELTDHGWSEYAWKTYGGYGLQGTGKGRANASRERIWLSPHCLDVHLV